MTHFPPPSFGVLLVGHGTRDVRGQREFLQAAEMLPATLPQAAIEPCFLELASPDIAAGIQRLAARGPRVWVVAPALLFAAAHVKRDIPAAVADAIENQSISGVSWAVCEPLGCHEAVLQVSAERFRTTLPAEAQAETKMLVMVGRGTTDADAIADMRKFTALRAKLTPVAEQQTAFLTGAAPSLDEALNTAASSTHANIIVQPHLLWRGQLAGDVAAAVARQQATAAGRRKRWAVAGHLGPCPEVVQALAERIQHCYTTFTP